MAEEVYLHYTFKHRKTGELKDGYIRIPDVQKYASGLKKCFDIHEYRLCDRRLVSKEEFSRKRK